MSRRFDNFAARLEASAEDDTPAKDVPTDPETPDPQENPDEPEGEPDNVSQPEKETDMAEETPLEERNDYKAGVAAGVAQANARMNAVFAHENVKGREAHAVRLLGRANLSAEEINDELAHFAVAEPVAQLTEEQQREAAEEAGRAEMKAAMEAAGNKDLGADDGSNKDGKTGRAAASAVWDRANATVGRVVKEG